MKTCYYSNAILNNTKECTTCEGEGWFSVDGVMCDSYSCRNSYKEHTHQKHCHECRGTGRIPSADMEEVINFVHEYMKGRA